MIVRRQLLSTTRLGALLVLVSSLTACAGSATSSGPGDYPIVEPPSTKAQAAVAAYETDPSPTCERALATYHDGSKPTRRAIVIPPAPGLRSVALTERTTRVDWSFRALPADCRPVAIVVSVHSTTHPRATPTTERVDVDGVSGSTRITYPEFLPPPDVAAASVYSAAGGRSRTVSVRIERAKNVPPEPPEPTPLVTAPAGAPIACTGPATVVDDPAGDVLTYAPGSPPARVPRLTPELSGIDITRATVRIDGAKMCGTFVFAEPPAGDFQLTLTLRDTTTSACCASLRFRRMAGRLEVGHETHNEEGASELEPVSGAGAALRGETLVVTGTLPPPNVWQFGTRRLPAAAEVGWSATTRFFSEQYGPYYGDWLPRHEPVGEPIIRHRDGATVLPGSRP